MLIPFPQKRIGRRVTVCSFFALLLLFTVANVSAQDTVTGAFEGIVSDSQTGLPLKGADVEIIDLTQPRLLDRGFGQWHANQGDSAAGYFGESGGLQQVLQPGLRSHAILWLPAARP